ncbi:MAG: CD225/dispanin family protein [Tannerella sp.]|jgi:hypothetical protein|nr:CD225/dispanin family protein [Tannerella sp.]
MNEKQYYYLNGDVKMGPFSLETLRHAPVKPDTPVWNATLPDWTEARALPELQAFFVRPHAGAPAMPPPPAPPATQAAYPPCPPPYAGYPPPGGAYSNPPVRPPMPDNYMEWSILSLLFCCWVISIFAIIESAKVNSLYLSGDYAGAQAASASARKYATWSALSLLILVGGYVFIVFIIALAGA